MYCKTYQRRSRRLCFRRIGREQPILTRGRCAYNNTYPKRHNQSQFSMVINKLKGMERVSAFA